MIMVLRLSATATTAIRIMKEEKLFLPLKAIFRTMNNSRFNGRISILAKIGKGLKFPVCGLKFKVRNRYGLLISEFFLPAERFVKFGL